MRLSAEGLQLIVKSEGFRSKTYLDGAGFPTIGYGHRLLLGEVFPNDISETHAQEILSSDVQQSELAVQRLVKVPLTQGQYDSLIDFCFNLGPGRLASSTLLKALNRSLYATAREQLLCWDLCAGQVSTGLKIRRQAEFELWGDAVLASPQPALPLSEKSAETPPGASSSTSSVSSTLR